MAALAQRFKGQLVLVSAAYNAGPRSVIGWFRSGGIVEADVFVESIPFRETRDYVKHMAQNRVTYALLYESKSLAEAVQYVSPSIDLTIRAGVAF